MARATENPQPPAHVIDRFTHWIRSFQAEPIFAAHPVALDGPWFDSYLKRLTGKPLFKGPWVADRLFRYVPLCIMSMVAGKTERDHWNCDVENYHRNGLVPSNTLTGRLMTLAATQTF